MTRAEALEKFKDRHISEKEELSNAFISGIEPEVEEMMNRFLSAFGEIADQAQEVYSMSAKSTGRCSFSG